MVAPGLDEDAAGVHFGLMVDDVSFDLLTLTATARGVSIDERGQSLLTALSMSNTSVPKSGWGCLFDGGLSSTRW